MAGWVSGSGNRWSDVVEMSFVMIKARIADAEDPADRRRDPRLPVDLDARVRELGSEGNEARVLNISTTGFLAETDGEFEVGSRIWLILPGRERANALVRWIAGKRIGAEFAEPIQLDALDA
ncbi:PilZ domain-containing protein [Sphingomonas sp. LY160]|uniref:PilZ domain-containing protein n=1 Tax=Sphingomonas sp. LY160 TaxID=3095342 RepID=UPI002ADEC1FF|nr:PilZ domain-containing protein [Sphingomonas sp. LY160]MEA1072235.1 PilZ domain-containing protein [Sphingomonas sp. LY160]